MQDLESYMSAPEFYILVLDGGIIEKWNTGWWYSEPGQNIKLDKHKVFTSNAWDWLSGVCWVKTKHPACYAVLSHLVIYAGSWKLYVGSWILYSGSRWRYNWTVKHWVTRFWTWSAIQREPMLPSSSLEVTLRKYFIWWSKNTLQ